MQRCLTQAPTLDHADVLRPPLALLMFEIGLTGSGVTRVVDPVQVDGRLSADIRQPFLLNLVPVVDGKSCA